MLSFFVWHENVDVYLVNQFESILAVSVIFVIDCFEQGIALPVQILFGHEGIPAENCLGDFPVGIAVNFHVKIGEVAVKNIALFKRDMD